MSEPTYYGDSWMNHCLKCGRSRQVPSTAPLLQQKRLQDTIQGYPQALMEVGPERPWVFAKEADLYHVAPTTERARIQQHGLQPADPYHEWGGPIAWELRYGPDFRPPVGVYGWSKPGQAYDYVTNLETRRGEPHDVWRLPDEGNWQTDPDVNLSAPAQYSTEPVMNAELFEGPEHRPGSGWGKGSTYKRSDAPETSPKLAETDAKPWMGKMYHGSDRGLIGPVRTPFWTTTHKPEAIGFGGGQGIGVAHPVQVRFQNPAYYFGKRSVGDIEMARANGNDGIVIHYPEDERDPSDPYPKREWAIALSPGAIVPGHDHEWPYG
jgi:hypothetical protein